MTGSVIGVDVGGTKIAAGVVGTQGGVLARRRVATPRTGQDDVLAAIGALVRALASDVRCAVVALGVAVPGIVDPMRGVVLSATDTIPDWSGAP
ncbi:MAG: ROK family protein, partial [Acidimicrobiales bacterium]